MLKRPARFIHNVIKIRKATHNRDQNGIGYDLANVEGAVDLRILGVIKFGGKQIKQFLP